MHTCMHACMHAWTNLGYLWRIT